MPVNTTTLTPKQREAIYEAWIAASSVEKRTEMTFHLELNDDAVAMLDAMKQKIRTLEQA